MELKITRYNMNFIRQNYKSPPWGWVNCKHPPPPRPSFRFQFCVTDSCGLRISQINPSVF